MTLEVKPYAHPEVLVDVDWVEEHRHEDAVKLVEVDVDTNAYSEGHIAGAVAWNWTTQLSDQIRRDVLSQSALEELLSQSGISNDDTIVLYGDNNNWFAAFAFWILKLYGHEDVRLMDGGRKKWLADGRALTLEAENPTPGHYIAKNYDSSLRSNLQEVLKVVESESTQLVDIRTKPEYLGEVIAPPGMTETAQRAGHIPGAQNIPWALNVLDDGTFKSATALQLLYASQGIKGQAPIITYCRIGERSSLSWFVLKYLLGYENVKNYDGSWTEYGSVVGVPIVKGSG